MEHPLGFADVYSDPNIHGRQPVVGRKTLAVIPLQYSAASSQGSALLLMLLLRSAGTVSQVARMHTSPKTEKAYCRSFCTKSE
jgi:hypothetical protein